MPDLTDRIHQIDVITTMEYAKAKRVILVHDPNALDIVEILGLGETK